MSLSLTYVYILYKIAILNGYIDLYGQEERKRKREERHEERHMGAGTCV
jgi:hypothetical protein